MLRQIPKSYTGLMLQCLIIVKCHTMAITNSKDNTRANLSAEFSARGIGRSLTQCFGSAAKLQCLEMQFVNLIDAAVQDNSTWQYNDFIAVEKRSSDNNAAAYLQLLGTTPQLEQRSLSDTIGRKLLQLAAARSIRLTLPRPSGISGALDDLVSSAAGSVSGGNANEGRKKKDKDKNMAMMGGMTILAMFAQLFLGKVVLIAGAAFVMAKIALLVSVLSSLKKGSSGSSGSTDHVIVTSGGGGGGHSHDSGSSGWHRSMPHAYDYAKHEVASAEHEVHEGTPATGSANSVSSNDHRWTPLISTDHEGAHKTSYYNYEIAENAVNKNYKQSETTVFL